MVRFNCTNCGCVFEAGESEAILIPRYDERHNKFELLGVDYCVRCPICNEVVRTSD